jgi:hypothetical protein
MRSAIFLFLLVPFAAACSRDGAGAAVGPRPWERLATPTSSAMNDVRGLHPARGILHSHSPYSHDACDGDGIAPDGKPRPECTADLRRAVCEAALDFVFLTDHADHMAEQPFEDLLFIQPGDEPIQSTGGTAIANRIPCGDGRRMLLLAGNENDLMSVGLEQHLPGDATARLAAYKGNDPATIDAMHAAGALVMIPHTESRTMDYLQTMPFDGMEVYNLHAAIDPDIRRDFFGLEAFAAGAAVLPFTTHDEEGPEPDLTFLGFFEDLPVYTERWDALLPLRPVTGIAGTDVHQNTFPGEMRDGERGDSYRRLMRWFSNVVLVDGEVTPQSVKDALRMGRSYLAFEILGTPVGFDFYAEQGSSTVEMGGQTPAGATLHVRAPLLFNPDPAVTPPAISMRLFRVAGGMTQVAAEGLSIDVPNAEAGIYRVEARITPHHLRPYLGANGDKYIRDSLWVMSNPIYLN